MTEEQWTYISAKLMALELAVLAIAKASPQVGAIKTQISVQVEAQEAALLFSEMSEKQVVAVKRYVAQISDAI